MAGNPGSVPTSQAHTKNLAPSQNNQGNVNCTFTQNLNMVQTPTTGTTLLDAVTEHDGKGETKAEVVSRHLKTVNVTNFLRPRLVFLCKNTKSTQDFLLSLHQSGVVSQVEADKCKLLIDFEKNQELYKIIGQTESGDELVQALEESENHHIIEKMHEWIMKSITPQNSQCTFYNLQ